MPQLDRAERAARNEALFRDLNAELEKGLQGLQRDPDERAAFVCECARPDCTQLVKLLLDEYRRAHERDDRFVVLPGHELPDVERVVAEGEGYVVIEKRKLGDVPQIVARDGP